MSNDMRIDLLAVNHTYLHDEIVGWVYYQGGAVYFEMPVNAFITTEAIKDIFGNICFEIIEAEENLSLPDGIQVKKIRIRSFSFNPRNTQWKAKNP